MKIALVTDLHFGARNDSPLFIEFFNKFYTDVFFPYVTTNKINHVIIPGDVFDRRKYTNHKIIQASRDLLFDKLANLNIKTTVLVGNHDSTYKNTITLNTLDLLLSHYTNIDVISKPVTKLYDNRPIALIPWICDDNYNESMHHIKTTNADVAIGHFELANFEFHQGQVSNHGLDASVLKRFKKVLSGHYHHRSTKDNITYLGTPYEMTWADYNDPKGFHVLDTETLDLEFIENHHKLFIRLEYADDKDLPDTSNIDGKFVKVIVQSKTDYYRFDQFVSSISGSSDLKIIESVNDLVFDDEILDNSINLEDTSTILMRYIDSIQTDIDKDDLKMFMRDLYIESLNAEDNYSC